MYRSTSRQAEVYHAIRALIDSGELHDGARLPTVRELAASHQVSLLTVQRALDRLSEQGIVRREHGRGIFVADRHRPTQMKDSVVLCIPMQDHLWSTLAMQLVNNLGQIGVVPHMADLNVHGTEGLLRQISLSDAKYFVIQGGISFPFAVLQRPAFKGKTIIGVVTWGCPFELPDSHVYLVTCDRTSGSHQAVEHLWDVGHRRVLIMGTQTFMRRLAGHLPMLEGTAEEAFVSEWRERGGSIDACPFQSDASGRYFLDKPRFLGFFREPNPPTAVFAQFDIGAWLAQQTLHYDLPELEEQVEIIGHGDTPWSQSAYRSISSISLELPKVAESVRDLLEQFRRGETPPVPEILVPARLVLRATSDLAARQGGI